MYVPYFGNPAPLEDPLRGGCVEIEPDICRPSHVLKQRLQSQSFACAADNFVEFRLRRALGHDGLCLTSWLNAMESDHRTTSGCALSRPAAPRPIGVAVDAELFTFFLDFELPN